MVVQNRAGFEKWQDGISKAFNDPKWNHWDCEIQRTVAAYNRHLAHSIGYVPLKGRLIKAMVWVETGANHRDWFFRPMQIGVKGDPGMEALLSGNEGGERILPPEWRKRLTVNSIQTNPEMNIKAGVGYLLMRMAYFSHQSVLAEGGQLYEITVKPGDSLAKIASQQGSTLDVMLKLNPVAHRVLRPGQKLKYQKASIQKLITGWRSISTISIAQRYNGGGDPNYARKLNYALTIIEKGKAVVCL